MHKKDIQNMILAGMMLALAIVLPFLTGSVSFLGQAFLPMHVPVIICGFICGPKHGGLIGFVAPVLRSFMFGMPPLYPVAIAMSFELAAYGIFTGLLYQSLRKYNIYGIYATLLISMILGRVVYGVVNTILLGIESSPYSFEAFISGAFIAGIPGIIFQLIVIPFVIFAYDQHERRRGPSWS
jgi:riboflavin transporter FmnP